MSATQTETADTEIRVNEYGSRIEVGDLHRFLKTVLSQDLVADSTNDLIFDAIHRGWHRDVVAESLRPIITEMLETATYADWQSIADSLLAEGCEIGVGA